MRVSHTPIHEPISCYSKLTNLVGIRAMSIRQGDGHALGRSFFGIALTNEGVKGANSELPYITKFVVGMIVGVFPTPRLFYVRISELLKNI